MPNSLPILYLSPAQHSDPKADSPPLVDHTDPMLQLLPARLSKLVQPVFGAKPIPLSFSERKFCERQSYSVLAWDLLDPHESHKLKCHSDRFGAFFLAVARFCSEDTTIQTVQTVQTSIHNWPQLDSTKHHEQLAKVSKTVGLTLWTLCFCYLLHSPAALNYPAATMVVSKSSKKPQ